MAKVELITGTTRQSFTPEQRDAIVAESLTTNESMSKFAKRMGIAKPTLSQWRKQAKNRQSDNNSANLPATINRQDAHASDYPQEVFNANFENTIIQQMKTLEAENKRMMTEIRELYTYIGRIRFESDTRKVA